MKFPKGKSGNPGGRPKVLGDVQELARQYSPAAIVELARLALKAKNENARIAAIRELLDRGYGRSRQSMEVSAPAGDPLQLLLEEIDALSRKPDRYKQYSKEPT
jgi:DNA-binding transcriptional MerR regulator